MKIKIKIEKEFDVAYLQVVAEVQRWQDAIVNGVEDKDGTLVPCSSGNAWTPLIAVETGLIVNAWPKGVTASINYKVCDAGCYTLLDKNMKVIKTLENSYVPVCLSPIKNGYGDYIIMKIDENGKIAGWKPNFDEWLNG